MAGNCPFADGRFPTRTGHSCEAQRGRVYSILFPYYPVPGIACRSLITGRKFLNSSGSYWLV